ncbi:MAG: LysR family transcriptional regulator [Gemmatimonadaceae bacterium]|nr:LysR family transcriptional regulator [Gemmatimonadaceae bacterium]
MLSPTDLEFFAVVAQTPSLAAAARALDVTPSAVTQRLQELERRVGVRLVERRGRRPTLTAEGELLLAEGAQITEALALLHEQLAARRGEVAGPLRVLAPFGFGRRYVGPVAAEFRAIHPQVTIELTLSDRLARVPDASWDVAIHIGDEPSHRLRAEMLAPNARVLCAAPSLIAMHGEPTSPDDVRAMPCLALRENDEDVTLWRLRDASGRVRQVRITPVLASNDGDVVRDWALAGLGVMVRSLWSVADDLRDGRLVSMLPDWQLPAADVVAYAGAKRGRSARTTAFVAYLKERLTPAPWA